MSSLTFARPPPLDAATLIMAPQPAHGHARRSPVSQGPVSPQSPLNDSPTTSHPFPASSSYRPRTLPAHLMPNGGATPANTLVSRAAPAPAAILGPATASSPLGPQIGPSARDATGITSPEMLSSPSTPEGTPTPTATSRLRAPAKISSGPMWWQRHPDDHDGNNTPMNTPANRPLPKMLHGMQDGQKNAGGLAHADSSGKGQNGWADPVLAASSLSTPLNGMISLNAATAMRARSSGVGIGAGMNSGNGHAQGGQGGNGNGNAGGLMTPGNTPSSLERVGRRLASNLMLGSGHDQVGQIAPSYERRFNTGLQDLDRKLAAQANQFAPSLTLAGQASPNLTGGSLNQSDWPARYAASEATNDLAVTGTMDIEGGR